jgi:hypothetical protein
VESLTDAVAFVPAAAALEVGFAVALTEPLALVAPLCDVSIDIEEVVSPRGRQPRKHLRSSWSCTQRNTL